MPSPTYTLFRNAILAEQQVICSYGGRRRELCPHIIGTNKDGEEAVLAWQFAGESSGKLPQWRMPQARQCPRCPRPRRAAGMRAARTGASKAASRTSISTSTSTCARIAVEEIDRSCPPSATTPPSPASNSTSRARLAFANYRRAPGTVIITHTETPRALRGRGIASELVQGALELIRADGSKVVAGCGFVVDYLRRHPEFSDLAR